MRIGLIFAGIACGIVGCGSQPPAPPTIPPTFSAIQSQVFTTGCAFGSCHTPAGNSLNHLDLSPGHAYANLVGVVPYAQAPAQDGLLRVKPGDPSHSLLYIKISGHCPLNYGLKMPETGTLSSDAINAIRAWIADGAPNN